MWYIFNDRNKCIGVSDGEIQPEENQIILFSDLDIPLKNATPINGQVVSQEKFDPIDIDPKRIQGVIVKDFFISKETLSLRNSCYDGLKYFLSTFPNGGNYQEIIDRCISDRKTDYVLFLLEEFGEVETIIKKPRMNPHIADLWEAIVQLSESKGGI